MAQLDRVGSANVDRTLIDLVYLWPADDMRNNREHDFIFRMILLRLAKEVLEDRNLCESGNAGQLPGLLVFHDPAQQVGLTISQANLVLDLALSDDGLADAADVLLASNRRDVHGDLQSDFAVGVHVRRYVDVDADIQILKLRVHQRVDSDATDAGLERSSRDGDPIADFQRSFLAIERANLRILNQLGIAVAHQGR